MATSNRHDSSDWRFHVVTWNVAAFSPPAIMDMTTLFNDEDGNFSNAEIIAVGLQEVSYRPMNYVYDVTVRDEPWTLLVRDFLAKRDYVQLTCSWTTRPRLMGVVLMIFIQRKYLLCVKRVEAKFCKTGWSGFSSHKGAVCIRLTVGDGTHVTFLCSHLAPFNEALSYRIKEYNMILNSVQFDKASVVSDDYVFWLGDLNFRVEGFLPEESLRLLETNYFEKLLEYDQLARCIESERAFYHFHEAPIKFKPTYKYIIGTSTFDVRRSPSWCDRILWRVENSHREAERQLDCHCLQYNSKSEYTYSDHKPVVASFRVRLFNFDVVSLIEFRFPTSTSLPWLSNQANSCEYYVSKHYQQSSLDWVGLFRPNFKTDEDVVTWSYVVTAWDDSKTDNGTVAKMLFKRQYMPSAGTYIVGYYSRDRNCLIALSSPFEIVSAALDNAKEASETGSDDTQLDKLLSKTTLDSS